MIRGGARLGVERRGTARSGSDWRGRDLICEFTSFGAERFRSDGLGPARRGWDRHGLVRQGIFLNIFTIRGAVGHGKDRSGEAGLGLVRKQLPDDSGAEISNGLQSPAVSYGWAPLGTVRSGNARQGKAWLGMFWKF